MYGHVLKWSYLDAPGEGADQTQAFGGGNVQALGETQLAEAGEVCNVLDAAKVAGRLPPELQRDHARKGIGNLDRAYT